MNESAVGAARPLDPHPAGASPIDPVVELAELLIVTRRFRDADLDLESARAILAMVRERVHRALAGMPPAPWPPQIMPPRLPTLVGGLPSQVVARLRADGIETWTDLAQMTRKEAHRIPGLGQVAVAQIAQELAARGMGFKDTPPATGDEP